jgi:putative nucleotide binding protein
VVTVEEYTYILDYLSQGIPTSNFGKKEPICYAVGDDEFKLFELVPKPSVIVNIGERVYIGKDPARRTVIDHVKRRVGPGDLTHGAMAELEYCVSEIVLSNQQRFIRFFNEAEPISMRKHLLEELPGLGKKTMTTILDERTKGGPFKDFKNLTERTGVKTPEKLISARIVLELKDNDMKRYLFVSK